MTAKEKLRRAVEELNEAEAAEALDLLARGTNRDAMIEFLDNASVEDEPISAEEERAVDVARDEIERGETIPLEQVRADLR